jgi:hypothetical protein
VFLTGLLQTASEAEMEAGRWEGTNLFLTGSSKESSGRDEGMKEAKTMQVKHGM